MSSNNHHRMMNLNRASIRNYDNNNDRNAAGFGANSDNADFESWACESFNLIDYLGEDTSPLDEAPAALDEDELQKQKEEALYSQLQYSDMLIGDNHQPPHQQHHGLHSDIEIDEILGLMDACPDFGMNDYASVPTGFSAGSSDCDVPTSYRESMHSSIRNQNQMYAHHHQNLDAIPYVPSTSKSSMPVVKEEPISEHEPVDVKMVLTPTTSRESSVVSSTQTIMSTSAGPSTGTPKPRKYRIKPEVEKLNPVYRIKRQKNNDAVRRSREKARHIQEAKENELRFLQEDNSRKAEIIETLKASNAQLQAENMLLKQNCRCGTVTRVVIKR